ncbi:MAG: mannose-1-phosphate guanylyltransferase/mannose-6-phosphate isomerase [Desulfohalobiaceae bacterium]
MIIPAILCGGSGTRLWPVSRELYPKQFLPLYGEKTLLQETLLRLQGLPDLGQPICVCGEEHRFLVAEQVRALGFDPGAVVLEPEGRNTAPAAAVAALLAQDSDPGSLLLILPADHVLKDAYSFQQAVQTGIAAAQAGALVTFGVVPDKPETGYGYIQKGAAWPDSEQVFQVQSFVEKPDQDTARQYLDSGQYLWNSGMFLFKADKYLQELGSLAPRIKDCCSQAVQGATQDMDFLRLDSSSFRQCPSDSLDYAVMEKTSEAMVVPLQAGWSDVGSWSALWEIAEKDEQHNVLRGQVLSRDVQGCLVHSDSRLVALLGVQDLVVVDTKDALLVASRHQVQEVKSLVQALRREGHSSAAQHSRVYRPWGSYEGVDQEQRFQVKRITVKPGQVLSLQKHYHRAEHWVVVKGTARVVRGEEEIILTEDQSVYIPLGTVHRLENPGRIPLELIEVQTGSYLGEDDIERIEDVYGRKG